MTDGLAVTVPIPKLGTAIDGSEQCKSGDTYRGARRRAAKTGGLSGASGYIDARFILTGTATVITSSAFALHK